ncbi:MAG: GtrA family protein [Eubacteriales bacterium]
MKETIIKVFRFFERFIKFSIVGLINTAIYFAVYYLMLYFGVHHLIANTVGYFAGSINGYLLGRFWVFKDTSAEAKQSVLKFYVVYGSSLLLSNALVALFVDVLGISDKIAPILTICFTTPYNYFLQKIWTFKENK